MPLLRNCSNSFVSPLPAAAYSNNWSRKLQSNSNSGQKDALVYV
jgi:hypothetical protein